MASLTGNAVQRCGLSATPTLHRYIAFGCRIESPLELPWLLGDRSDSGTQTLVADVLRIGTFDEADIMRPARANLYYQGETCHVCYPEGFQFRIDANGIGISSHAAGDLALVQQRLITTGFAAWFCQQQYLQLHGSVFDIGDKRVIVLGNRGAGKSSVLNDALAAGARLVADDVAVIDTDGCIRPGFPALRLHRHQQLPAGASWLGPVPGRGSKHYALSPEFDAHDLRPSDLIVHLVTDTECKTISSRVIDGMERILTLANNGYRPRIYDEHPQHASFMNRLFAYASQHPVVRITRPDSSTPNSRYRSILPVICEHLA